MSEGRSAPISWHIESLTHHSKGLPRRVDEDVCDPVVALALICWIDNLSGDSSISMACQSRRYHRSKVSDPERDGIPSVSISLA
jgi:hypothetical protein